MCIAHYNNQFYPLIGLYPSTLLILIYIYSLNISFVYFMFLYIVHVSGKGVGLEANTEKTKYMLLSRHQNVRQKHDINIADIFWNCGTVHIFGNEYNKSKPDSGGN
jgi:hypothetical protein